MAYEKECDIFLRYIYDLQYKNLSHSITPTDLEKISDKITPSDYPIRASINNVTSILVTEGLIQRSPLVTYQMTDKGVAFLNTDTFVNRRKRWNIENYHKSFLYKTRHFSYVLSIAAILLSVYSIFRHPQNTQRILLLPTQESKVLNSMHDTLSLKDTSLK